jgi:hypothetical protein
MKVSDAVTLAPRVVVSDAKCERSSRLELVDRLCAHPGTLFKVSHRLFVDMSSVECIMNRHCKTIDMRC